MNAGKSTVTVSVDVNINKAVKDAYDWALRNDTHVLIESYVDTRCKDSYLSKFSRNDCEHELFVAYTGNGTPDGDWETYVQHPDGRITAKLCSDKYDIYADIMYTDGGFRLVRWHF